MSQYTDAVARGLKGLTAVSTGACPGCEECASTHGYGDDVARFTADHEAGRIAGDANFSWSKCGICGTHLGGNREDWHAITGEHGDDVRGRDILHFDDACTDCVLFLANGDEPEGWEP